MVLWRLMSKKVPFLPESFPVSDSVKNVCKCFGMLINSVQFISNVSVQTRHQNYIFLDHIIRAQNTYLHSNPSNGIFGSELSKAPRRGNALYFNSFRSPCKEERIGTSRPAAIDPVKRLLSASV